MSTDKICKIDVWICRAPLARPVATSFGAMNERPGLFLRLENSGGAYGFGEIWCNFPARGAEHRAHLVIDELSQILFSLEACAPSEFFTHLTRLTHIRSLQSGERGPYAQAIAGLDIAAWDLHARAAGEPVRKLLDEAALDMVPSYASGIHIRDAKNEISKCRAKGHRAFKVKVGFDLEDDCAALMELVSSLEEEERLFCDANQIWDIETALRFAKAMGDAKIGWLEEPLPADAPANDWKDLAGASGIPLAAGENIASKAGFDQAINSGSIAFIQPDIAKWGGFTGCMAVARAAMRAGRTYCPHFLGGGIGLIASANLLAAAGGNGLLELDINPNPLRDAFLEQNTLTAGGSFQLSSDPGLGVTELPGELSQFEIMHQSVTA
jgi:L-alanine-DL-glutamate epimerase-like enolase superfamily enzyme